VIQTDEFSKCESIFLTTEPCKHRLQSMAAQRIPLPLVTASRFCQRNSASLNLAAIHHRIPFLQFGHLSMPLIRPPSALTHLGSSDDKKSSDVLLRQRPTAVLCDSRDLSIQVTSFSLGTQLTSCLSAVSLAMDYYIHRHMTSCNPGAYGDRVTP